MRYAKFVIYALSAALFLSAGGLEFRRRQLSTRERARTGVLRDDVELFGDALATSLRLPEACRDVFGRMHITPGETKAVTLNYGQAPDRDPVLREGAEPWVGTHLGRVDLIVPKDSDQSTRVSGRIFRRYRSRLATSFKIPDRFVSTVERVFEVLLWLDDQEDLRGCFGPSSIGALCNLTGGYYDTENTEQRCRPSLFALVETNGGALRRGSCRVNKIARRAADCPGGPKHALVTQGRAGFGATETVICQTCE